MYVCDNCGYQTNRKSNFEYHNSRKFKCKFVEATSEPVLKPVPEPVKEKEKEKCLECSKSFTNKSGLKNHKCTGCAALQCPTCSKYFNDRKAKSRHVHNCKSLFQALLEDKLKSDNEVSKLKSEVEMLKSVGATTINNTNNTNNSNNTNNTININFNNYDKPNTDHITNQVMKGIYETSQRDPALILNETVRRIYLNDKHPENHVIKITDKAAYSKVYKDGKEISLPMGGVIQTVLSNTGEFCADRIRDCHEEGVIIGDRARYVWQLMEVLGTDDRDDDALNRSLYIQSIKSAFL